MRAYFSRRYRFSASHRLHSAQLSAEENQTTYGKCNNPYGHGHNYILQVTLGGPVEEQTGMVINLTEVDAVIQEKVLDRFDHSDLNRNELFLGQVPTTENLCSAVYALLKDSWHGVELVKVRVEETENNFFEIGPGSSRP